MATDVTATYEQALARSAATAAGAATRVSGSTVLLVRGFLSDAVVKIGALIEGIPAGRQVAGGIGEYFDAQMQWLGRIQVPCERVMIESEAPVRDNAQRIRGRIETFPRVFIISHSKGCLDVLEALLGAPALWSRLSGWIAIQGPFAGTPVADAVAGRPLLRTAAAAILAAAGGSIVSIDDM